MSSEIADIVCKLYLMSLVLQGYFVDDKIHRVVSGMAKMIHDMGMKIVSEGVETEEQMNGMLELGVDYIQGYCFSRPIPEDEFIDYLKMHN